MVERKVCHVGKEVVGLWSGSLEGESAGGEGDVRAAKTGAACALEAGSWGGA